MRDGDAAAAAQPHRVGRRADGAPVNGWFYRGQYRTARQKSKVSLQRHVKKSLSPPHVVDLAGSTAQPVHLELLKQVVTRFCSGPPNSTANKTNLGDACAWDIPFMLLS